MIGRKREAGHTGKTSREPSRSVRSYSRLMFAAAVIVLMLGAFVSFGGVGLAASSARHSVASLAGLHKQVGTPTRQLTAADDQYHKGVMAPPPPSAPNQVASAPQHSPPTSGQLPFTGASLLGTAITGLILVALGLLLRRRERRSS